MKTLEKCDFNFESTLRVLDQVTIGHRQADEQIGIINHLLNVHNRVLLEDAVAFVGRGELDDVVLLNHSRVDGDAARRDCLDVGLLHLDDLAVLGCGGVHLLLLLLHRLLVRLSLLGRGVPLLGLALLNWLTLGSCVPLLRLRHVCYSPLLCYVIESRVGEFDVFVNFRSMNKRKKLNGDVKT